MNLSTWTNFSVRHLKSAKHFANLSRELEKNYESGTSLVTLKEINTAYVTGAIFAAVAFLESSINELFAEAKDDAHILRQGLSEEEILVIIELHNDLRKFKKPRKMSLILFKYKKFLEVLNKKPINEKLFHDVESLIYLRNNLVHYEPEWITSGSLTQKHPMETKLKGKFAESKLYENTGNNFYPSKCLGSGCADWVIKHAELFADEFYCRLKIRPIYK